MTQQTNTKTQNGQCLAGESCEFDVCEEVGTRTAKTDAWRSSDDRTSSIFPAITMYEPNPGTDNDWIGVETSLQQLLQDCARRGEYDGALRIAGFLEPTELSINLLFNRLPHEDKLFDLVQKMIDMQDDPEVTARLSRLKEVYFEARQALLNPRHKVATDAGTMVAHGELVLYPA